MSLMKLNNKSLVVLAVLWQLFAAIDARCDEVSKDSANFQIDESTATTLSTKIDELVSKEYFDKSKVDKIWRPAFDAERSSLLEERNLLTFATHVNSILSRLHTSHTQLYTPNDEGFFFMRNLFGDFKKDEKNPHKDDADFVGIGVGGARAAANQIRYVIDASPAALAGIKRGDKIKSLNDNAYSGYGTWYQTSGKAQKIKVERDGKELELKVTPVKQDFLDGYVTGTTQSARIIKNNGVKIGYLHFWSGGVGSQDAMAAALGDKLRDTDALVLDLRDGYGGASNECGFPRSAILYA